MILKFLFLNLMVASVRSDAVASISVFALCDELSKIGNTVGPDGSTLSVITQPIKCSSHAECVQKQPCCSGKIPKCIPSSKGSSDGVCGCNEKDGTRGETPLLFVHHNGTEDGKAANMTFCFERKVTNKKKEISYRECEEDCIIEIGGIGFGLSGYCCAEVSTVPTFSGECGIFGALSGPVDGHYGDTKTWGLIPNDALVPLKEKPGDSVLGMNLLSQLDREEQEELLGLLNVEESTFKGLVRGIIKRRKKTNP